MAWTIRLGKRADWRLSFGEVGNCIRHWRQRRRSRRQLSRLDERLLRDIGLDRRTALEEAYKPFWRG